MITYSQYNALMKNIEKVLHLAKTQGYHKVRVIEPASDEGKPYLNIMISTLPEREGKISLINQSELAVDLEDLLGYKVLIINEAAIGKPYSMDDFAKSTINLSRKNASQIEILFIDRLIPASGNKRNYKRKIAELDKITESPKSHEKLKVR